MVSYSSASINLINSVIGAGVLALPFSLKTAGLLLGLVLLVIVCMMSACSLHLLHHSCRTVGSKTYYDLALYIGGKKFATVVEIIAMLYLFGALVSYVVIIGDMIHGVATAYGDEYWQHHRLLMMAVATWGIVFPVSCLPSLDALRHTSLIALVCIAYLVLIVTIRSFETVVADMHEDPHIASWGMEIFQTVPIIAFAFTCQVQFIPVYAEFDKPDQQKIGQVINFVMIFCMVLYGLFASFGYIIFNIDTKDNILINFTDPKDYAIAVGKIALATVICFSCPLMVAPSRSSLLNLYDLARGKEAKAKGYENLTDNLVRDDDVNNPTNNSSNNNDNNAASPSSGHEDVDAAGKKISKEEQRVVRDKIWWTRHVTATVVIIGAAFGIGIAVPRISIVFGITGAIGACSMAFIFPGIFFLKNPQAKVKSLLGLGAIVLVLAGVVFLVVSTVFWFIDILK